MVAPSFKLLNMGSREWWKIRSVIVFVIISHESESLKPMSCVHFWIYWDRKFQISSMLFRFLARQAIPLSGQFKLEFLLLCCLVVQYTDHITRKKINIPEKETNIGVDSDRPQKSKHKYSFLNVINIYL